MCRCAVVSPEPRPRGYRHRFDPGAFVGGLMFLTIAGWYGSTAISGLHISVVIALPGLLVALAVVGFVRVATRSLRR